MHYTEPLRTSLIDKQIYLARVFYRCLVLFDSSEPLRTTLMVKKTLGEDVLQVFGVVRCLSISEVQRGSEGSNLFELHTVVARKCTRKP